MRIAIIIGALTVAAATLGLGPGAQPAATRAATGCPTGSCDPGSNNSFTPDTVVLRGDGTRDLLGNITAGDLVQVSDPATGQVSSEKVLDVIIGHGERRMYALTIDGASTSERLLATAGHAFHVRGRGHTPIEQITRGNVLIGFDGAGQPLQVPVRHIEDLGVRPNVTVVNLRVAGPHTFTVISNRTRIVTYGA